jgi:hypothetical protein
MNEKDIVLLSSLWLQTAPREALLLVFGSRVNSGIDHTSRSLLPKLVELAKEAIVGFSVVLGIPLLLVARLLD